MTQDMLEAAAALSDALRRENDALISLDLLQATALLGEKTIAVERFTAALEDPDAPLIDRHTTIQAAHRLRALADENRRLLEHALAVQTRVLGTIRQAALRPSVSQRYRKGGRLETQQSSPFSMRADV